MWPSWSPASAASEVEDVVDAAEAVCCRSKESSRVSLLTYGSLVWHIKVCTEQDITTASCSFSNSR